MAEKPKRAMVLGFDSAILGLIERHIGEGHLPTFKKLIEGGGAAENCLVPYPTICYQLDFPLPEQTEGGVIYQIFEDPNFKVKEVQRLREGLAKMEAALSSGKE